ncbi:hypothetical protein T05_4659 [Trichinella murrelli]|uniref:Uncharacterized protein n=1 Tax=Trichinella murrelli TaxID=144512 RepID=A0A0V0TAI6_9BILA|nr:hypothetical protein T05_4659 [Trichinella murrelli]
MRDSTQNAGLVYVESRKSAHPKNFRPLWHGRPAGLPVAGRPVAPLCCPPTGKFFQCSNVVATLAKLLAGWRILHGRVAALYSLALPTSNY